MSAASNSGGGSVIKSLQHISCTQNASVTISSVDTTKTVLMPKGTSNTTLTITSNASWVLASATSVTTGVCLSTNSGTMNCYCDVLEFN